jgi:O-antigen/teichoic acid export membrane protein
MLLGLVDLVRKDLEVLWATMSRDMGINFKWAQVRALMGRDPSIIALTMVIHNLLRIVGSLVLTRILAPEDFGIIGLVTVVQYTVVMLFDAGTDTFIVRHHDIRDRRLLDVVWTVRFVQSIILAAVLAVSAGLFARILGNESLTSVLVVSALGFLAGAPQSLSFSLAIRDKRLILVSCADIFLAILVLVLTIGFAFYLRSYWAFVISGIAGTSIRTLLSYVLFPSSIFRFSLDAKIVGEIWKFSRFVAGSSILTLFLSQIDKFVLGHFLTIGDFGIYMLAVNISFVPRTFCGMYGQRVLFPTYAQAYRDDPNSIRRVFYEKLRRVGPLYCFLVGGLIGFAPVVIAVMYQERYAPAAYYLALLSIPTFFVLSSIAATEALVAVGEVRVTYQANLVRLSSLIPALALAMYSGRIDAILIVIALSELSATIYIWWKLWEVGVLTLRRELLTFLLGALGIVTGWVAYKTIGLFFHIPAVGLLR